MTNKFKNISEKDKGLFVLFILLFVTIYPRIQTYFLPFTKQLAAREVYGDLANETKDYIKDTYGNRLTAGEEEEYISEEYKKRLKEQKDTLKQKIEQKTIEKKAYWQDDNAQTYLLEFDPYYLYRYTNNLLDRGTISDRVIEGKLYDAYSYAPKGKFIRPSLIIYVGFFFHKIFTTLNKNLPLVNTLFSVPLILTVILSLTIFFFVKRFFGITVAFISVFVITLTPIFLSRSVCGWYDTDCFNLLLPFLITFLFYTAIKANSFKKRFIPIISASFCLGLYSLAWNGWWHFFYIIMAGVALYILNTAEAYFKYREKTDLSELKNIIILSVLFIAFGFLFVAILAWPGRVMQLFREPFSIFRSIYAKRSFIASLWPNTFITVAELRPTDLKGIVMLAGDPFIFFISLFGLFVLLKIKAQDDKSFQYFAFVFSSWFIISILSALRALRFSLLLAIPQGICFSVAVKFIIDLFLEKIKILNFKKALIYKTIIFAILLVLIINLFFIRVAPSRYTRPVMNDDYQKVIEKIKKTSSTDTLINSWWDYGSWYAAMGKRRVIFDGTTQNTPIAYWMARMLLTNDETEAIGILRMLNNGSNNAFDELKKAGLDDLEALQILNKIIVLDRETAEIILKDTLQGNIASKILEYTHAEPPSAYYIADDHMIEIIQALALLGNWKPEKAFAWQVVNTYNKALALEIIQRRLNLASNLVDEFYRNASTLSNADLKNWASHSLRFYSGLSKGIKEGEVILFDNSVALDLNNFNTRIKTQGQESWKRPHSLFYPKEDGSFREVVYNDGELPFSILLVPDGDNISNIILDRDLAKSMLVRLFFLKGHGLKFFRFLFSEKDKEPSNINVWEVDWQGRENNIFSINRESE